MPPMISVFRSYGQPWEIKVDGRFEIMSHDFNSVMARVGELVLSHRGIATVSITDDYTNSSRRVS